MDGGGVTSVAIRRPPLGGLSFPDMGWVTSFSTPNTARDYCYKSVKSATELAKGRHLLYNIWQMAPFQISRR